MTRCKFLQTEPMSKPDDSSLLHKVTVLPIQIFVTVLAISLTGCGCGTGMVVDASAGSARLGARTVPVAVAERGLGGKPGSKQTPVGTFTVMQKQARHRFGPVIRLGGVSEDGYRQDGRGILGHQTSRDCTNGCLGFRAEDMPYVYEFLKVGDIVRIKP